MFSHCLYGRHSDNVAPLAAVTIQNATAATGYLPSWVCDFDASRPSKLNETTGCWLFDFADSPQAIAIVAIVHSNFQSGMPIHIQANNSNVWNAPPLHEVIIMPSWHAGHFPPQPWLDLRAVAGAGAYRYWKIAILNPNPVPLAVGEVWLGTAIRQFPFQW